MAFDNIKIVGDDTAQVAIVNDVNTEAVVNGLVAYNTTENDLVFSLSIDDVVVVVETVTSNSSFRFVDKLNIPVGTTMKVDANIGIDVTVSFFQQAIDSAAALTVVQQLAQSASDDADRAENALPEGTIDDASTETDKAWSASKIANAIEDAKGFDYTETTNPTITTNSDLPATWINSTTGEIFVCTDNTTDDNYWVGTAGTVIQSAGIETPSILTPADGDTDLGKNITFTFSDYTQVGGNDEAHLSVSVQVSDVSDFTNIITETIDDTTNLTSWVSGDLEVSTTYYARVLFKSDSYESMYSATVSITTKDQFTIPLQAAGSLGYGVVPSDDDFASIGLSELTDTNTDGHAEYGNYQHSNGSIMCHIPKTYYRVGHSDNPTYDDYGENSIDTKGVETFATEADANDAGYTLHRAFIDAGAEKNGVFVDKYMNSKSPDNTAESVSVFGGVPISLTTNTDYTHSDGMDNCTGILADAVTIARARGSDYAMMAFYHHGLLALLSVAHAQAVTSVDNCAWYDDALTTNYPKGCNSSLSDVDDSSVTYDSAGDAGTADKPKTGATAEFNKTTHNGCANGVADLNGGMLEMALGMTSAGDGATATDAIANDDIYILKTSSRLADLTAGWDGDNDAWGNTTHLDTLFDKVTSPHALGSTTGTVYWGSGSNGVFTTEQNGVNRDICGFIPKDNNSTDDTGTNQCGTDYFYRYNRMNMFPRCHGSWSNSSVAGLFYRSFNIYRSNVNNNCSFRAVAYVS